MATFQNYIDTVMLSWLRNNNLKYKKVEITTAQGSLLLFFNENYCIKIYDCLGHGYGVTINVADRYDESIYENDAFTLYWAYQYFDLEPTASFDSRSQDQYQRNLPKLKSDLKTIIPLFNRMTSQDWTTMKEWIRREAWNQQY